MMMLRSSDLRSFCILDEKSLFTRNSSLVRWEKLVSVGNPCTMLGYSRSSSALTFPASFEKFLLRISICSLFNLWCKPDSAVSRDSLVIICTAGIKEEIDLRSIRSLGWLGCNEKRERSALRSDSKGCRSVLCALKMGMRGRNLSPMSSLLTKVGDTSRKGWCRGLGLFACRMLDPIRSSVSWFRLFERSLRLTSFGFAVIFDLACIS